jgi:hypothetical protein
MDTRGFKKLIKEAVREAIQEELKDILLEAVRAPKTIVKESYAAPVTNLTPAPAAPSVNAREKYREILGGMMDARNGNLNLTSEGGDLLYEGEIVEYRITPMTATADQRAAQNRLTIAVMVRFVNRKKEGDNFEKRFSFFYDFDANQQLVGSQLTTALADIFERITQDVFNESLAKW